MGRECLVLSVGYEPVALADWEKAFMLVFKGEAEVVEEYEERKIRSARQEWSMPSVVRLLTYISRDRSAVKFSRENIYARDRGACQYCGKKVSRDDFEYEHVVPQSRGGRTTWENIVVACTKCNQKKGNKTPAEARMKLLKTPVKPEKLPAAFLTHLHWRPHMPQTWRPYLRDVMYWKDELENDEAV